MAKKLSKRDVQTATARKADTPTQSIDAADTSRVINAHYCELAKMCNEGKVIEVVGYITEQIASRLKDIYEAGKTKKKASKGK
jgi:hypothetical protein